MTKICIICEKEKEFSEFHKSNRIKDGFKNECKICIKLYRENNIDKYKALEKKYRDNNKEIRNINFVKSALEVGYQLPNWRFFI